MRLVFVDIETGGLDPARHPIIQIAAIAVDAGLNELDSFECKIKFSEEDCEPEAIKANSYDAEIWKEKAVYPRRAFDELAEFLRRYSDVELVSQRTHKPYKVAQLVGHNAASFDGPFIQNGYRTHGLFLPAAFTVLDTLQRALWHFHERPECRPENFKLATLCKHFGVPLDNAHDALADVRATVGLYRALVEQRKPKGYELGSNPIDECGMGESGELGLRDKKGSDT